MARPAVSARVYPGGDDPPRGSPRRPRSPCRDPRPTRRFGFRLNRITLITTIGGIALAVAGLPMIRMSSKAKSAPQDLTCQQLSEHGYGANAHVRMSDFVPLPNFVYNRDKQSGRWSTVWVPVASIDLCRKFLKPDGKPDLKAAESSSEINVVLRSDSVASEAELTTLGDQDTVDGLVVNDISPLGKEEKENLQQNYPSMDLDHCWILQAGRTVNSVRYGGLGMLAGGLALAALGLWLTFKPA